jgi:hypothetical protein
MKNHSKDNILSYTFIQLNQYFPKILTFDQPPDFRKNIFYYSRFFGFYENCYLLNSWY